MNRTRNCLNSKESCTGNDNLQTQNCTATTCPGKFNHRQTGNGKNMNDDS